jgi:hypothetical protein
MVDAIRAADRQSPFPVIGHGDLSTVDQSVPSMLTNRSGYNQGPGADQLAFLSNEFLQRSAFELSRYREYIEQPRHLGTLALLTPSNRSP